MDHWLKSLAGLWGEPLLNLYIANSRWINALVLAYGVFLLISWWNLRRIRDYLREAIATQVADCDDLDAGSVEIPWEQAIQISRFPWIAAEWGLLPRRTSVTALQELMPVEGLLSSLTSRPAGDGVE